MHTLPCVIVAGGKSRRMGVDKALLPFGGFDTLTEFQLHKLHPYFKDIYISCKNRNKFDFEANFIEDDPRYHDSSPLIALVSIFEYLKSDYVAVLSVDTPFFTHQHFQKLHAQIENDTSIIVSKSSSGVQPLCAIYKKDILPLLLESIREKNHKMQALFEKTKTIYVEFDEDEIFANLNFQEDYQKALQRNHNG